MSVVIIDQLEDKQSDEGQLHDDRPAGEEIADDVDAPAPRITPPDEMPGGLSWLLERVVHHRRGMAS